MRDASLGNGVGRGRTAERMKHLFVKCFYFIQVKVYEITLLVLFRKYHFVILFFVLFCIFFCMTFLFFHFR